LSGNRYHLAQVNIAMVAPLDELPIVLWLLIRGAKDQPLEAPAQKRAEFRVGFRVRRIPSNPSLIRHTTAAARDGKIVTRAH
jgi:hypothetical protein